MASGTTRVKLTATPQRLDNQGGTANLFLTIRVLSGSGQFFYMAGATAPAVAALDKGFPKSADGSSRTDNELVATMNAADSLWATGDAELAILSRAS